MIVRIDRQRSGGPHGRRIGITVGEHETRHPVGERRLADALRSPEQPGMRDATAAIGIEQRRLSLAMPEQRSGFARMPDRNLLLDLARAHAGLTAVAVARCARTALQTA